jgi:hypothetical protein
LTGLERRFVNLQLRFVSFGQAQIPPGVDLSVQCFKLTGRRRAGRRDAARENRDPEDRRSRRPDANSQPNAVGHDRHPREIGPALFPKYTPRTGIMTARRHDKKRSREELFGGQSVQGA